MKIKVYVYAKLNEYTKECAYSVSDWSEGQQLFGDIIAEREIDAPEAKPANLVPGQVARMRAEQQQIRADAEVKAQAIEQRIGKLLAIEA